MTIPEPGMYRHFKGGEYEVLDVAHHSETKEVLVIYRAADTPQQIWARPLSMFTEPVLHGEERVSRFEPIALSHEKFRMPKRYPLLRALLRGRRAIAHGTSPPVTHRARYPAQRAGPASE